MVIGSQTNSPHAVKLGWLENTYSHSFLDGIFTSE